jgi:hypothetical protein
MNSGDRLQVTFNDIPDSHPGPNGSGLQVVVHDLTTGTSGSMVASSQNGFGMVQAAPSPSTACNAIPYNFHPMYNTSSPAGRVIWAAHTYNIAFADEIGHWDSCSAPAPSSTSFACNPAGLPVITEGDGEPSDADDTGCFPPSALGTLPVTRCIGTNGGFDGTSYRKVWPTGESPSSSVPTPITFTSPRTGGSDSAHDNVQYGDAAFETDLPRIEGNDLPGTANDCQRLEVDDNGNTQINAGQGCSLLPLTDDSLPGKLTFAAMYPWFNTFKTTSGCVWQLGAIKGSASSLTKAFGRNAQYGTLLPVTYLSGSGSHPSGGTLGVIVNFEDFQHNLGKQPCPA